MKKINNLCTFHNFKKCLTSIKGKLLSIIKSLISLRYTHVKKRTKQKIKDYQWRNDRVYQRCGKEKFR